MTPLKEKASILFQDNHLLKLCNDTIYGRLTPIDLNTAACGLMASDYFYWDNTTKDGKLWLVLYLTGIFRRLVFRLNPSALRKKASVGEREKNCVYLNTRHYGWVRSE